MYPQGLFIAVLTRFETGQSENLCPAGSTTMQSGGLERVDSRVLWARFAVYPEVRVFCLDDDGGRRERA